MRYTEKTKTKKSKVFGIISYIVGSVVLSVAAIFAIPKMMLYVSGAIYKRSTKASNVRKLNDDWGPIIRKK